MRGIGWRTLRGGGLWSRLTRLHEQAQVFAAQHGHASGGEVAPPVPAASLVPPPSAFVSPKPSWASRSSTARGSATSIPTATCVVCDACGRRIEVGGLEVVCTGCNGHLSLPEGTDRLHCPWCQAEVRRT